MSDYHEEPEHYRPERDQFLERPLPSDPDTERAILGSILLDNSLIAQAMELLTAEDFYVPSHSNIFKAMAALFEYSQPIDPLLLCDQLRMDNKLESSGGASFVSNLVRGVPHVSSIVQWCKLIKGKAAVRRVVKTATSIIAEALEQETPDDEIVESAQQQIFAIALDQTEASFTPAQALIHKSIHRAHEVQQSGKAVTGITTGYADLDAKTRGFQKADLIFLAARPGTGKTTLGLNFTEHAALDGKAVAFFSLEMAKDGALPDRIVCAKARVDADLYRSGMLSPEHWDRISAAEQALQSTRIYINDTPAITPLKMKSKLRRLISEHGPMNLVVVDYLQLMKGNAKRYESLRAEVTDISSSLKNLAREFDIPFLVMCQLNRNTENRTDHRPQLADLRESGCLAGDTLIPLHTGERVPIKELASTNTRRDIWALSGNKIEERGAVAAFSSGVKSVLELVTKSGRRIKATDTHKFYGRCGWKSLKEFTAKEEIAVPLILPVTQPGSPPGDADIILAAHLIGDGCTLPSFSIHYTTGKIHLAQLVAETATEVFGETVIPKVSSEYTWHRVDLISKKHLTHGVRNPATLWAEHMELYGKRGPEKRVPSTILQSSDPKIGLFLRHLWSTDGHIGFTGTERDNGNMTYGPSIVYSSSSRLLVEDVAYLLLRLGIRTTVGRVDYVTGRPTYTIDVVTRVGALRFLDKVGTIAGDPRREVEQKIREWAKITKSSTSWSLKEEADILWDRVKSLEPAGEEEVFDLTVPAEQNFVANGFIVHNSLEQDADLVLFIYREAMYTKKTEHEGTVSNIAEIIIGKQRNGDTGTVALRFAKEICRFDSLYEEH